MAVLSPAAAAGADDLPLVVDLDGTLLRTDTFAEALLRLAKERPAALLALPCGLARGRAALKARLADRVVPEVPTLPVDTELLDFLRAQRRRGRRLVLATGADRRVAQAVAERLGLFDAVLASDGHENLTGECKRRRLVAAFGERGFDYVGNGRADLPVWRSARRALLVAPGVRLLAEVGHRTEIERVFGTSRPAWRAALQAMRPHHWLKNGLLFVAALAAHRLGPWHTWLAAAVACAGFCAAASATYLLNDLFDLGDDRRHPRKRDRALASGRLPLADAFGLILVLWGAAAACALALPRAYALALGGYAVLMLAYCLRLKDVALVDAFTLGLGYTLRIAAGALALALPVSPRLLACSLFLFFSLALLKRDAEIASLHPGAPDPEARVRAYRVRDRHRLPALGAAAAAVAVLLLAGWRGVEPVPQARPAGMAAAAMLLTAWLAYMWQRAHGGRIHDDPVSFALTDPPSLVLGLASLAALVMAS